MLDKFIIDEKAEMFKYDMPHIEDKLRYPGKDQSNFDMHLFGQVLKGQDPLKPHILDDKSVLDTQPEGGDIKLRDIIERVEYEDSRTDHSFDSLTPD